MNELSENILNEAQNKIKILVVDDHPLVRQALSSLIQMQSDMEVVGEACNGEEAIAQVGNQRPDIVIMDIGMPVMNGLEATRNIKARYPDIAILVLTVHTDKEHVLGILEAGAAGYLTKVVFGNDVVRAIQAIAAGEAVLTPVILQQILSSVIHQNIEKVSTKSPSNLTPREIFILKLAAKGLSNKNIAVQLNLSERTVKSYLVDIFSKIHVSSRTEAVITGLKAGFISLSDLE